MSIFRRHAGATKDAEMRDVAKAHRVLDRYRAGSPETQTRVNWALRMTGDLTNDPKELNDDDQKIDC